MVMPQETVRVSAPGKVILHGEHSVVYGKKAIAVSVGLLTKVTISPASDIKIKFPDVGIDSVFTLETMRKLKSTIRSDFRFETLNAVEQIPIWEDVQATLERFSDTQVNLHCVDDGLKSAQKTAFQAVLFMYLSILDDVVGLSISVGTELPVGAGLGSSASFAVALAGAILVAGGRINSPDLPKDLINRWAFVSEKFVHGSPSGVDNTVAAFGSGLIFQKGADVEFLQDFPNIRVLLVNTKVPRSTKALVSKVADLKELNPKLFDDTINGIESIVDSAITQIKQKGTVCPDLISQNHEHLKNLGVSHPSLEFIIQLAKDHSLSAKLTGAGGGGCAFVLIPGGTAEEIVQGLKSVLGNAGLELWETKLGCGGVSQF